MRITHSAVEVLNENLRKSMILIQLMAVSSDSPKELSESLDVWQDDLLVLLCLIDDIQGVLITDLSD